MTADRRRRDITVHPDGRWFDNDTLRAYLSQLDARAPKRATVERLSKSQEGGA